MDMAHHYITSTFVNRRLRISFVNCFIYRSKSRVTRESKINLIDVPNLQSIYCQQGVARGYTICNSISLEIQSTEVYVTFKYKVKI